MLRIETDDLKVKELTRQDVSGVLSAFLLKHGLMVGLYLKNEVASRLRGWKPSEEALRLYPFLVDYEKFVTNYVSCLSFNMNPDGSLDIYFDGEQLKNFGYPEDLPVIVEHGGVGMSILQNFDYARIDELMLTLGDELGDEVNVAVDRALGGA